MVVFLIHLFCVHPERSGTTSKANRATESKSLTLLNAPLRPFGVLAHPLPFPIQFA
jgi:hypothetical protein